MANYKISLKYDLSRPEWARVSIETLCLLTERGLDFTARRGNDIPDNPLMDLQAVQLNISWRGNDDAFSPMDPTDKIKLRNILDDILQGS